MNNTFTLSDNDCFTLHYALLKARTEMVRRQRNARRIFDNDTPPKTFLMRNREFRALHRELREQRYGKRFRLLGSAMK